MLFRSREPKSNTKEEIKRKIMESPDFIKCPRYNNSLNKYLAKSPETVEDKTIARLLMINLEDVERIYKEAVTFIKKGIDSE